MAQIHEFLVYYPGITGMYSLFLFILVLIAGKKDSRLFVKVRQVLFLIAGVLYALSYNPVLAAIWIGHALLLFLYLRDIFPKQQEKRKRKAKPSYE